MTLSAIIIHYNIITGKNVPKLQDFSPVVSQNVKQRNITFYLHGLCFCRSSLSLCLLHETFSPPAASTRGCRQRTCAIARNTPTQPLRLHQETSDLSEAENVSQCFFFPLNSHSFGLQEFNFSTAEGFFYPY